MSSMVRLIPVMYTDSQKGDTVRHHATALPSGSAINSWVQALPDLNLVTLVFML